MQICPQKLIRFVASYLNLSLHPITFKSVSIGFVSASIISQSDSQESQILSMAPVNASSFLPSKDLNMGSIFSFFVLSLQLSVHQTIACSSPYREIEGVCVHLSEQPMNWCRANDYCSSVNGELVRGGNFMPLNGKSFTNIPSRYWIGLTDLLQERYNNRAGWRWTDGELSPSSSNLLWNVGNPSKNGLEDCVSKCAFALGTYMCDVDCYTVQANAMCQQRSKPSSFRVRGYNAVPIRVGPTKAEFAQGGCLKVVYKVKSRLRCAILCNRESNDRCESFYFNRAAEECRLVLHADATFNMGAAIGWQKLAKKR